MEIDDLRALDDEKLKKELGETRRELMNLRFRVSTMQLTNVHQVKKVRKKIARLQTVMQERKLAKA